MEGQRIKWNEGRHRDSNFYEYAEQILEESNFIITETMTIKSKTTDHKVRKTCQTDTDHSHPLAGELSKTYVK